MRNGETKNMYHKILITGSSGFVGINLRNFLRFCFGDKIQIIASNAEICNLTNYSETEGYLSIVKPDCIIHLAAVCGGIGANRIRPGSFINTNLSMGLNIINAAVIHKVKKFIMLGSICAYPKFTPIPFKEEDLWNGYPEETNAPYGIAKRALTEVLLAYHKQYEFNSVNLYPTNMYGPFDNFDLTTSHVIPAIILKMYQAIVKGEDRVELWGTGTPTRDFLYVGDCCRAIVQAIEKEPGPEPMNIGTNCEISIKNLAEEIASIIQYSGDIIWNSDYPDGQPRRMVSSQRALERMGYQPYTYLHEGLNSTIKWFLNNVHEVWT